jgi:hypothetical protein
VKAVVNLEAAGAGGPALAFQIGSADLAYAYASVVPYPHTMVTVREIRSSLPPILHFVHYRAASYSLLSRSGRLRRSSSRG